ncbi:type VII secretion-associated serine protease mycosin [Streptomyces sp. NPDC056333]|uniref:type VII secretion-associated serine protease mycosin n=1 Tax=Streptomyces sp. NPDC056333 TaxID=3345786 RepID=UPI0035D9ACC6
MSTSSSSTELFRRRVVVSATLGLLLAGSAAGPAHADSVRSRQWHLTAMRAEEMWETSTGENVTVAVIDSGVDSSNPDLQGQVLKGKDLAPNSPGDEHTDYNGHGTGMAGLIAGTGKSAGGDGAFGLAPGSKILPIRMRDDIGRVNGATGDANFNRDLPIAIRFAVDHGAKVINISLGNGTGSRQVSDAVKYALENGSLIFSAVGNSGDEANAVEYPAGTPGVVGVGAIGEDLRKAGWSQYGPQVDLSAPGVNMIHACSGETGVCKGKGTSDATAIASASAALIWSKHPDWTNNQVLRVMLNTAGGPTSGAERNDYVGYGVVRPRIALKTPGDPGPADEYPLPDLAGANSPPVKASEPSASSGGSADDEKPAATAPAAEDGGNTGPWIGLGIGAAALIGVAFAALAVRSRRRKSAAVDPQPYGPPHPYQQQPPPYPTNGPPPGACGSHAPYGDASGQGPSF